MELNIVVMKVSMVHILFPHSLFSSILVFLGPGLLISIPEFKKVTTISWYMLVL